MRDPRCTTKALLVSMSKHLERQALSLGETAVVLSTFQHGRHLTPSTVERYRELAARTAFVAALGQDLPPEPMGGVRGGSLAADDPVLQEWDIAVVSPHFAGALVARDHGDTGIDAERRFDFVLTYDRSLVMRVAWALMSRVLPQRGALQPG